MSEKAQSWVVFILSLGVSTGGVLVAAFITKDMTDGGRGGAVGTAIALCFMFINRDYGGKLYRALTKRVPNLAERIARLAQSGTEAPQNGDSITAQQVKKELDTFVDAIAIDAKGQQTQNKFLALATSISTILWGFGDLLAGYLIKHPF